MLGLPLLLVRLMSRVKRIKYERLYLPAASVAATVPRWRRLEKPKRRSDYVNSCLGGRQFTPLSFAFAVDRLNLLAEHLHVRLDSVP